METGVKTNEDMYPLNHDFFLLSFFLLFFFFLISQLRRVVCLVGNKSKKTSLKSPDLLRVSDIPLSNSASLLLVLMRSLWQCIYAF